MNKKKIQTVTLVTPSGHEQVFNIDHAERLLAMGDKLNGGWAIAENEKYYFSKENGIRLKSDKADSAKTE